MAISASVPRGPVTASINFYKPPSDSSVPFNFVGDPPAGQPQRNFSDTTQDTLINDVRGREANYTLDHDAFQVIQDVPPSHEKEFRDDDSIKEQYYPEQQGLHL
ncbi:hypothetical protein G7046_g8630 [Stylonectria norvegica]|nr:hypothetical protein G7046_g8630 [Stylonectria norvegica]